MTRILLLTLALLLALPAEAAEWGRYDNPRFGVSAEVPPGFAPGPQSDNGDGQSFATPTARLSVFGSFILEDGFEAEVAARKAAATAEGWGLSSEASTPGWAVWSGRQGSRILYARAIPLCSGAAIGVIELVYMVADQAAMEPVVTRVGRSLRDAGGGC